MNLDLGLPPLRFRANPLVEHQDSSSYTARKRKKEIENKGRGEKKKMKQKRTERQNPKTNGKSNIK